MFSPYFYILKDKEIFGSKQEDGTGIQFVYESDGRLINSAQIAGNITDQEELALLEKTRQIAFAQHSQMTVLTGRRRIGKTKLILKSCEESPTVYLFVSRSNEAMLCRGFAQHINSVLSNIFIPESINSFADVFEMLMRA